MPAENFERTKRDWYKIAYDSLAAYGLGKIIDDDVVQVFKEPPKENATILSQVVTQLEASSKKDMEASTIDVPGHRIIISNGLLRVIACPPKMQPAL